MHCLNGVHTISRDTTRFNNSLLARKPNFYSQVIISKKRAGVGEEKRELKLLKRGHHSPSKTQFLGQYDSLGSLYQPLKDFPTTERFIYLPPFGNRERPYGRGMVDPKNKAVQQQNDWKEENCLPAHLPLTDFQNFHLEPRVRRWPTKWDIKRIFFSCFSFNLFFLSCSVFSFFFFCLFVDIQEPSRTPH